MVHSQFKSACVCVCERERLSKTQHIFIHGLCTVGIHSSVCQLAQHNTVWSMVRTQLQSSFCVCVCVCLCVNEPSLYMTSKLWVLDITWFNFKPKPNILVINFWLGTRLECVLHVYLFLVNISLCFPCTSSVSFWVSCIYSVVCIFFYTVYGIEYEMSD